MPKSVSKIVTFAIFILGSLAAGFIGSSVTTPAIPNWYAQIEKPFFNPPNWVFAPVWTLLYILMGTAASFVWLERKKKGEGKKVKVAMVVFAAQLILNTLWSSLFFYFQNPALAFFEIIFLWVSIALMIKLFYRINKAAGLMIFPYIAWVSFASILNFAVWQLN